MNKIDELTGNHAGNPEKYAQAYLDYLASCFRNIDCTAVAEFIQLLLNARESGNAVYFIGNGGSAATASHFANDLSIGTRTGDDKPFRAISLTDNVAVMTALANDEGYNRVAQITVTSTTQFTYSVPSGSAGTAGGTPVFSYAAISGTTNVSGVIQSSKTWPAAQGVTGWARKSTSAPYYRQTAINISDASGGTDLLVALQPDD